MAIPVQFQQFKSAGIYRVVYDKSTVLGTEAELLRLVVGYSAKGPFNTPVYVKSVSDFKAIYGDISKTLEKRGCFFHRTAIHALEAGPIICLNLKAFDPNDKITVATISDTVVTTKHPVKDIFDTTRFWKLDPTKLDTIKTASDSETYLHVASTDSKETSGSIFIRKAPADKVKGYDIAIKEWFDTYNEPVPEYLDGVDAKISDFFTEVFVFSGKFDNVESSSLKNYFEVYDIAPASATGEDNAYAISELTVDDSSDRNLIYFVKSTLDETYKGTISGVNYAGKNTEKYNSFGVPVKETSIQVDKDNPYYFVIAEDEELPVLYDAVIFGDKLEAGISAFNRNTYYLPNTVKGLEDGGKFEVKEYDVDESGVKQYAEVAYYSVDNDLVAFYPSYATVIRNSNGTIDANLSNLAFPGWPKMETGYRVKDTILNAFGEPIDALTALYNEPGSGAVAHYVGSLLPNFIDPNYGYKAIDILFNIDSDSHHMMMSLNDALLDLEGGIDYVFNNYALQASTGAEGGINREPIYLEGYTYSNAKPANNSASAKLAWQETLLNVLNDERGLREGLLSPAEIDYRYIVDSFASYPTPGAKKELKSQLSLIAKQKELCFAIVNFPAVSDLCKFGDSFTTNGVFNINKVIEGIVLPSENNGASFCAFYTPLKFSDGYVDTIVPSAGLVSNLFMSKYNGRAPYSIVAGPNYANVQYAQLVGPDYNYSQDELNVIEPFGVNCMIYRPTFGTFINANQTAKQTPKTALSAVNVRELVIFLQDEIGKVLQAYQWEFNNATTREAIKAKANIICETAKSDGGITAYLNVIDESNNTADIIDNEMCVLSTSIEPGRGAGKMIHELTIYRTGGMSATITEA